MTDSCDLLKDRLGYNGQKYQVQFTHADGTVRTFGWQNEPEGGLAESAALHPGWTNVRVLPVPEYMVSDYNRANGIACPYCGKPIETPVQRRIIARPPRGTMTFCSEACGGYYQMGCEG